MLSNKDISRINLYNLDMKAVIEVKNLVKKYAKAEVNAVDNVSFTVEPGEFFSLLGPNGAGKTTTISILTTILSKTGGSVHIVGHDIDREAKLVRRKIGIIFQNPSLDRNLTAEENIRFHAVLYGLYPYRATFTLMDAQYRKRVLELAEIVGIEKELFKPIKTYSGGMKRKLEIVRSLMHEPEVLFLDEPTTGLDPISRNNLWQYLTQVREKQHMTIFLTTHYLVEAEDADRVCIINHGKVTTLGTPADIKSRLIESYLLVDSKDRSALKKELADKKLDFTENKHIRVDLGNHEPAEVIQHMKTPLSFVRIHAPTLEEAYVELIETKNEK